MAITKIPFPTTGTPVTATDYTKQNELIANLINNNREGVLTEYDSTTIPKIKQGAVIPYAGNLYIVDTSDYTIGGSTTTDNTDYYIKLSVLTADTLQADWVSSKTGYSYNVGYQGWYDISDNALLTEYMRREGSNYIKNKWVNIFNHSSYHNTNGDFVVGKNIQASSGFGFDYIVNSQSDWDALIASGTWLGATTVLINSDVTETSAITIPSTVKKIIGSSNSSITFNVSSSLTLIKYSTLPTTYDYEISSLNIILNADATPSSITVYVFENIQNTHDCYVFLNGSGTSPQLYVFKDCNIVKNNRMITSSYSGLSSPSVDCLSVTGNVIDHNSTITQGYVTSYASSAISATYACADTGNGGFNARL